MTSVAIEFIVIGLGALLFGGFMHLLVGNLHEVQKSFSSFSDAIHEADKLLVKVAYAIGTLFVVVAIVLLILDLF